MTAVVTIEVTKSNIISPGQKAELSKTFNYPVLDPIHDFLPFIIL